MAIVTESSEREGRRSEPAGGGADRGTPIVRVRSFEAQDYPAVVALANRAFPEYGDTVDEWRFWDANRGAGTKFARFVGEVDGQVVGYAQYEQWEGAYHPRKFGIDLVVDAPWRRQGVGAAMYAHLWTVLAGLDPIALRASAREDYEDSVRFLERRGFRAGMRAWESRLDLQAFDAAPYAAHLAAVAASGIRLAGIDELANDPDRDRKLHELDESVARDVPSVDPHTPVPFESWADRRLKNPNLLPCLYVVALDGDRYVGLSNMWASQHGPTELYTGLTGTRREYRRRGIALALKVTSIARAKALGYARTRTWNETGNEGMLAINARLGFVRQPAWITFVKDIAAE